MMVQSFDVSIILVKSPINLLVNIPFEFHLPQI